MHQRLDIDVKDELLPKVTIGMSIHNEARYLPEALDSLLAQDFSDFELNIYDNGSQDGSESICRAYAAKDKRVRYIRHENNQGGIFNGNLILQEARGGYLMYAAGHDIWHPEFLSCCIDALERDPSAVLSYPIVSWIDAEGNDCGVDTFLMDLRSPWCGVFNPLRQFNMILWDCCSHSAIYGLIRTSALRKTRGWVFTFGHDTILLSELSLLGPFAQVPRPIFYFRKFRDYEEVRTIKRQLQSLHSKNHPKKIYIPYARFAWEYFMIAKDAPPEIYFSDRVGIVISLLLRFTWKILCNPLRCFRVFVV